MTREEAIEVIKQDIPCEQDADLIEAFDMAIQALSQEPCDDAISREDVIKLVECSGYDLQFGIDNDDMCDDVMKLPSVTQKSGEWILLDECANSGYYCSRCQKKLVKEGWSDTVKKIKFCPNCGAKMVEPQESEDKEI